ncbi:hypothetical protein [Geopsychrobacter electrodiphilus]|uniref:hypothetical protein n=1 Tax=Geopsychrobacter electrodiphilus TaxID=225196 RepID=UPI00037E387E|nr:hypothetical protein [Geopsychrobacter electrodiphilus]
MKNLQMFLLILLLAVVAGCSSSNSDAPLIGGNAPPSPHPTNWVALHGAQAKVDLRGCQGCHGFDFKGAGDAVSCFECHASGPPFTGAHPASWNGDPLNAHQANFSATVSPTERIGWKTCATAGCHGVNLEGSSGPTCQNTSCHTTGTAGWPPAPHGAYAAGSVHGPAAKDAGATGLNMGNYCLLCHGTPDNNFNGGFVIDKYGVGNCSACHTAAMAHPTTWVKADTVTPGVVHSSPAVTDITRTTGCALCHNTTSNVGASPVPAAPSCYTPGHNGLVCHATGPTGVPHAVPFTDPNLHGPAAKADLTNCQQCHSDNPTGGAGSNPRFNLATGSMPNGCETCHAQNAAHPADADRWTFNLVDTGAGRRTHFAAGNVSTACALCHNVNDTDTGSGTAPACITCHTSTTTFTLDCTACHGKPPAGGTDLTGGTGVNHLSVAAVSLHEECSVCHGASDDQPGKLVAKLGSSDYKMFNASDPALNEGGDHLDGNLEMNVLGAGYDSANGGCTLACHGNDSTHQLTSSGLTIEPGDYGSGSCDACHGYPPTTDGSANDKHPSGVTPVDHSGANILAQHLECNVCHGKSQTNGLTDNTATGGDAYLASYHQDGKIEMNGISLPNNNESAEYDETTHGCAKACHANDSAHQLTDSGLPVQTHEYGSGACNSCHGYPPTSSADAANNKHVGITPVNHDKFSTSGVTANHNECNICHGYSLANGATDNTPNGGDQYLGSYHRDGNIEMNGISLPNNNQSAEYNETTFGCAKACHADNSLHELSDSGLPVQTHEYGGGGSCDSCHGYPPNSTNNKHAPGVTPVNHDAAGIVANHDQCSFCHGVKDDGSSVQQPMATSVLGGSYLYVTATDHIDGKVTMNGNNNTDPTDDAAYNASNGGCDNSACHANDTSHRVGTGNSGTLQLRDLGPGKCTSCHYSGNTVGAPAVTSGSTHVATTSGGAFGNCTDCHSGHVGSGGVTIELPPSSWITVAGESHVTGNMQTILGIDYTTHGGINLGGPGTVASINGKGTEAEICWGCHDANGIGELASGGGATYKFGVLATAKTAGSHVSDWTNTSAWRQDAYDSRLTRPIASVHSVNMNGITGHSSSVANNVDGSGRVNRGTLNASLPGNAAGAGNTSQVVLENKQDIRCSYCHDVHSLNKALGDGGTAAPYLRGTWLSDPYNADVPPTKNETFSGNTHYYNSAQSGGMPRPKSTSATGGGYFIDQNSGNPTSGKTLAGTAGLCTLCHGTNVDGMDYYTGSSLWYGSNGHSNAVLGGSGLNRVNLFDGRRGGNYYMAMQGSKSLGAQIDSNSPAWGRGGGMYQTYATRNSGWYGGTVDTKTRGGDYSNWYSASGIGGHTGTVGARAHEFSCSKCHSPHATGLPALLITNCLDTELGGWTNPNRSAVTYATAQSNNCHRKTTSNALDIQNNGWNTLAPKQ